MLYRRGPLGEAVKRSFLSGSDTKRGEGKDLATKKIFFEALKELFPPNVATKLEGRGGGVRP